MRAPLQSGKFPSGSALYSKGFSLVEIMVGMVMGLLAMIVIYQMFALFESQKRTTTGGGDAQNNAAISMHNLQQDIEVAGFGISSFKLLSCNVSVSGKSLQFVPIWINPPTSIVPAGAANTDTMLIFYGGSNTVTEGGVDLTAISGMTYTVQSPLAFRQNDVVFASPDICPLLPTTTNLVMDKISTTPPLGSYTVTVQTGATVSIPASLYSLGSSPKWLAYAVRNFNLTVCDYFQNNCSDPTKINDSTVWVPVANDIVSFRAQYGVDTSTATRTQNQIDAIKNSTTPPSLAPNYIVNTWSATWPGTLPNGQPTTLASGIPTACTIVRIPAVRVVLVARGGYEKDGVTGSCATCSAPAPTWAGNTASPINLSAGDSNWEHYRYKALETIVPLRNINWMGVQDGC